MPKGKWTPIVAMDLCRQEVENEFGLAEDPYLEVLSVLSMLPGNGQADVDCTKCTRDVHGLCFGTADGHVLEFSDEPMQGFLPFVGRYQELAAAASPSQGSRSLAPVIRRASVIACTERGNHDAENLGIIVLTQGPVSAEAFHETMKAVMAAQDEGFSVVCLGVGPSCFGAFLEDTLPELCPNFKFLHFDSLTGIPGVRPGRERSHCARQIARAVAEGLCGQAQSTAKRFCRSCGRLPSSKKPCACLRCDLAGEAKLPGCVTPDTACSSEAGASDCTSRSQVSETSSELGSISV